MWLVTVRDQPVQVLENLSLPKSGRWDSTHDVQLAKPHENKAFVA